MAVTPQALGGGGIVLRDGREIILDPHETLSVAYVFALTFGTALFSGLGVVPFAIFGSSFSVGVVGLCNAIAAGLMASAVLSLLLEGVSHHLGYTALGIVLGVIAMFFCEEVLKKQFEGFHLGDLDSIHSRRVVLVIGAIASHAIAEGLALGLSFTGGHVLGIFITAAMALHNIPEGTAIAIVLLSKEYRMSLMSVAMWVTVSHLPQPIFAVFAFEYLGREMKDSMLPGGLGFASGAMMYIVITELIPEACKQTPPRRAFPAILISIMLLTAFNHFLLPEL
jgi:zinc transporter ZupT